MSDSEYLKYYEAVRFIESIGSISSKNHAIDRLNPNIFLKRTRFLLNLVGNPDKNLQIIHVAGTSGKGTVCNLLQNHLISNGQKTGLYTSPYVTTLIEKFKVNDKCIKPNDFVDIVNSLKPFINNMYNSCPYGSPSYFELCFVIAMIHFKQQKCDWIILETGLGGSYDCTNVIKKPKVCAITNIGYDHTDILGKTLTKIARDKSGIAKKEAIFITSEKRPNIVRIIKSIALDNKVSKFITTNHSIGIEQQNNELVFSIIKSLGYIYKEDVNISKIPGRFEVVNKLPLTILDGAHNYDKISYTLERIKKLKYNKMIVVFAIADNKDISKILPKLIELSDKIFVTRFINSYRKHKSLKVIYNEIKSINSKFDCQIDIDANNSFDEAVKIADPEDLILVIGSFYLVGEIRIRWYSEKYILDSQKSF